MVVSSPPDLIRPAPRIADTVAGPESEGSQVATRIVTTLIVVGPVVAIGVAIPLLWGHLVSVRDVLLGAAFYIVSSAGITVGYHRLFAHRSFAPKRWLKIAVAAAGSTA